MPKRRITKKAARVALKKLRQQILATGKKLNRLQARERVLFKRFIKLRDFIGYKR